MAAIYIDYLNALDIDGSGDVLSAVADEYAYF